MNRSISRPARWMTLGCMTMLGGACVPDNFWVDIWSGVISTTASNVLQGAIDQAITSPVNTALDRLLPGDDE